MKPILQGIAFCMWERSIARQLGITHGYMKDLMLMRVIPAGSTYEEARELLDAWYVKHPTGYRD